MINNKDANTTESYRNIQNDYCEKKKKNNHGN